MRWFNECWPVSENDGLTPDRCQCERRYLCVCGIWFNWVHTCLCTFCLCAVEAAGSRLWLGQTPSSKTAWPPPPGAALMLSQQQFQLGVGMRCVTDFQTAADISCGGCHPPETCIFLLCGAPPNRPRRERVAHRRCGWRRRSSSATAWKQKKPPLTKLHHQSASW